MRTTLLNLALVLLSLSVHGQDATTSPRWKIGLTGSADYCSYLLYIDNKYEDGLWITEQPGTGWSSGFLTEYALTDHWSLTAATRFTEHNCTTGWMGLFDRNGDQFGKAKFTYHMRYIDAPIGIQYNTDASKMFSFISSVAITPGYALGEWTELNYRGSDTVGIVDSQQKSVITDLKSFSLKAELYAGVGINVKQFQFQVLPEFRMSLLKATSSTYVNRQYWTTGIEFRLLYQL